MRDALAIADEVVGLGVTRERVEPGEYLSHYSIVLKGSRAPDVVFPIPFSASRDEAQSRLLLVRRWFADQLEEATRPT